MLGLKNLSLRNPRKIKNWSELNGRKPRKMLKKKNFGEKKGENNGVKWSKGQFFIDLFKMINWDLKGWIAYLKIFYGELLTGEIKKERL